MNISGTNSFLLAAQASLLNTNQSNLEQNARTLAAEIQSGGARYDMASENRDLSQIWQRARDWGLAVQNDMAQEARTVAMRASNGAVYTDSQRNIMQKEIQSLAAETTRIGLTNNINGSHTLARYDTEREYEVVEGIIEGNVVEVKEIKPKIDVLWVVDRSWSLDDHIESLKNDAKDMFKQLEEKGFDVRMAVESFEESLDSNGSTDFTSDVDSFLSDVNNILDNIYGGHELAFTSLTQALDRFGGKFDEHATKITVLITDESAQDFGKVIHKELFDELDDLREKYHDAIEERAPYLLNHNPMPKELSDKIREFDREAVAIVEKYKQIQGWAGEFKYYNKDLVDYERAEAYRQQFADKMKSLGSEFFVAGTTEDFDQSKLIWNNDGTSFRIPDDVMTPPDEDFIDVVNKVGKGAALKLDYDGRWVSELTDRFIASVETDIKESKFTRVFSKRLVSENVVLLDEWDMNFQLGPHSNENTIERFKTSTSETSGLANADVSTADKARESLSVIDDAIGFLGDNSVQVGSLQNQFTGINNTYAIKSMNQPYSATMPYNAFRSYLFSSLGGAF